MAWFLSFGLGFLITLQAAFNRDLSVKRGLPTALLANNSVALAASVLVWAGWMWMSRRAAIPMTDPLIADLQQASAPPLWIWIVPGLIGMLFVMGVPAAIREYGALKVTVGIIAGQIVASIAWDLLREGQPMTASRGIGAGLVLVGAILASR